MFAFYECELNCMRPLWPFDESTNFFFFILIKNNYFLFALLLFSLELFQVFSYNYMFSRDAFTLISAGEQIYRPELKMRQGNNKIKCIISACK